MDFPLEISQSHSAFKLRPAVYPHDNTWSIFAMKDITVEFVHVMTGPAPELSQGQLGPGKTMGKW